MNSTHIHLLLNHFPVIGTLLGGLLLLWGIAAKQSSLKSAAAVILAAMAVIAIPVFLTGEPAEESIENLPGVSESFLELHEEAASLAMWLLGITGVASLLALWLQRRQHARAAASFLVTVVLALLSFAAMARTGYYGGKIRHTEIRSASDQVDTPASGGQDNKQDGEKEKDDDD